jgi:hypothetical protein
MDISSLTPKQAIKRQAKVAMYVFLGGIFISILLAFPIKWLWNWLVPDLFGGPVISAIQAWGISFLVGLIVKPNININEPKPKDELKH